MLLHLRGDDRGGEIRRHGGGRERPRRGGRIALVRHGRRAAAAGRGGLERLRHVGLHQQRDVAGDLAAGAGQDGKGRCELGEPVAMGVPGRVRQRQVEQRGEPLGDRDAAVAQRRERAGGAAELQHQRLLAQPPQPLARARERRRIAGELEPERHRHRMLQQRARDRRGAAMLAGERREAVDRAIEVVDQRIDGGAQFEHQRGVDDVLAGGAPMHVARRLRILLGDLGGQRLDERRNHRAGLDGLAAERLDVIALGARRFGDRIDAGYRDDAERGLGARQRSLDVEHVLQARTIVEDRAHRRARDQGRQQ